jgi:hypothetical protein
MPKQTPTPKKYKSKTAHVQDFGPTFFYKITPFIFNGFMKLSTYIFSSKDSSLWVSCIFLVKAHLGQITFHQKNDI